MHMPSTSAASRFQALKSRQRERTSQSADRVRVRQQDREDEARLEEDRERADLIAKFRDEAARLLSVLVREGGWSREDAVAATRFKTKAQAVCMIQTLQGAVCRSGLIPPSKKDWERIRLSRLREKELHDQRKLREDRLQAELVTESALLGGIQIEPADRRWAVRMLEIIPESEQESAREEWRARFSETEGLESDRYREANLSLLRRAKAADPRAVQAVLEESKKGASPAP